MRVSWINRVNDDCAGPVRRNGGVRAVRLTARRAASTAAIVRATLLPIARDMLSTAPMVRSLLATTCKTRSMGPSIIVKVLVSRCRHVPPQRRSSARQARQRARGRRTAAADESSDKPQRKWRAGHPKRNKQTAGPRSGERRRPNASPPLVPRRLEASRGPRFFSARTTPHRRREAGFAIQRLGERRPVDDGIHLIPSGAARRRSSRRHDRRSAPE